MEENKELYIPENCPSINYVVVGFAAKEILYVGISIIISIILGFFIYIISSNTLIAVFCAVVLSCSAVVFFRRDRFMENCIDKIMILIEFYKSPKKYTYEYFNIYETEVD